MITNLNLKALALFLSISTSFVCQAGHENGHNEHEHVQETHSQEVSSTHQGHHATSEVHAEATAHGHDSHSQDKDGVNTPDEVKAYIEHHLQDSHDFTLFSDEKTGKHYGFPLPVILVDNGVKVFMSSEFHHGESIVEKGGAHYKLYHGKIYKTNAQGIIAYDENHHVLNEQALDLSITKNVFSVIVIAFIMIFMFASYAKTYQKGSIPTGIGRVLEPLVLFVRDEIARPNIGEKKYRRYMGFLLTVFFFIWITNLLGMTPLGINVTGNIAVTMCLAIFTFLIIQFTGNKDYWKHIFWMPGVPVPMKIVLAPIEVLGMFTKPFSLLIRLFANITAGHTVVMGLLAVIYVGSLGVAGNTAISLALTLFINLIELLVAFLQAYIFTMLSSLFIGMAVEEHDHH